MSDQHTCVLLVCRVHVTSSSRIAAVLNSPFKVQLLKTFALVDFNFRDYVFNRDSNLSAGKLQNCVQN